MNLAIISRRIAHLAARAPRPRLHRGLIVRFVDGIGGKPAPLSPGVKIRKPEARDPRLGLDVVWLDSGGTECPGCAQ